MGNPCGPFVVSDGLSAKNRVGLTLATPSSRRVKVASVQPLSNQGEEPIGEKSIGATEFEPAT